MRVPFFQVDAFTDRVFGGNPAAVCMLEQWLPDAQLQAIAAENNLSETAFVVSSGGQYRVRWFTPTVEVDLCGHATLAGAHVILNELGVDGDCVAFESTSGPLFVRRQSDMLALDFPARPAQPCDPPDALVRGLGGSPVESLSARDYLVIYESEDDVLALQPDVEQLLRLQCVGVIASAPGDRSDFVSRFFAPSAGVPEDPVTGSAHCTLVPYWSNRLDRTELHAFQVSPRRGELFCEHRGERVIIAGRAVTVIRGELLL